MNKKPIWKNLAIIFIVLFVLQTLFVVYMFKVGSDSIAKRDECIDICAAQEFSTYYYDEIEETCYCMMGGEVKRTIDLK